MAELRFPLEEIPENGSVRRTVGEREIAVFRKGSELYAIDANCPHRRGPLDEAILPDSYVVACPWHGWQFDIRTGKSPSHPAQVFCYDVRLEDGLVVLSVKA
jgi:nitrite reductase/ring-hydroxylating ferredoxin subunit